MHSKKIENVLSMSVADRYNYFIRTVVNFEELWGVYDNGWASLGGVDKIVLPFWPEMEFAALCCTGEWKNYKPTSISLDDFIQKWIPGMIRDNRLVNIFYIPNSSEGSLIEPALLLEYLTEEMEQY
ncbi:MAG: DUF2750 domain-containing protein [Chitinophagaceae bacterium]